MAVENAENNMEVEISIMEVVVPSVDEEKNATSSKQKKKKKEKKEKSGTRKEKRENRDGEPDKRRNHKRTKKNKLKVENNLEFNQFVSAPSTVGVGPVLRTSSTTAQLSVLADKKRKKSKKIKMADNCTTDEGVGSSLATTPTSPEQLIGSADNKKRKHKKSKKSHDDDGKVHVGTSKKRTSHSDSEALAAKRKKKDHKRSHHNPDDKDKTKSSIDTPKKSKKSSHHYEIVLPNPESPSTNAGAGIESELKIKLKRVRVDKKHNKKSHHRRNQSCEKCAKPKEGLTDKENAQKSHRHRDCSCSCHHHHHKSKRHTKNLDSCGLTASGSTLTVQDKAADNMDESNNRADVQSVSIEDGISDNSGPIQGFNNCSEQNIEADKEAKAEAEMLPVEPAPVMDSVAATSSGNNRMGCSSASLMDQSEIPVKRSRTAHVQSAEVKALLEAKLEKVVTKNRVDFVVNDLEDGDSEEPPSQSSDDSQLHKYGRMIEDALADEDEEKDTLSWMGRISPDAPDPESTAMDTNTKTK